MAAEFGEIHPSLGDRVHAEVVDVEEVEVGADVVEKLSDVQPGNIVEFDVAEALESRPARESREAGSNLGVEVPGSQLLKGDNIV